MMYSYFFASSSLVLGIVPRLVEATCYYPNGKPITPNDHPGPSWTDYVPCNPDPNVISMCCATNRTNPDECLPNGLCGSLTSRSRYYRESCSDPSWDSPFCLRDVCTNFTTGGTNTTDSGLAKCDEDGSYCCGTGLTSEMCCGMKNENRFFLAATAGQGSDNILSTPGASTSSSSSSTASTSSTESTSSAGSTSSSSLGSQSTVSTSTLSTLSSTPIPDGSNTAKAAEATLSAPNPTFTPAPEKDNMTKATKIHIAAGAAIGSAFIILVSLLTYCFISKRKRKHQLEQEALSKDTPSSETFKQEDSWYHKPELDTWEEIHMIGDSKDHVVLGKAELQGEGPRTFELGDESERASEIGKPPPVYG